MGCGRAQMYCNRDKRKILVAAEVDKMGKKWPFTSLVVLTGHLAIFNCFWMLFCWKKFQVTHLLKHAAFCVHTSILVLVRLTLQIVPRSITKFRFCNGQKVSGTVHLILYKYCPMHRYVQNKFCLKWCQECVYNNIVGYSDISCYRQSVGYQRVGRLSM